MKENIYLIGFMGTGKTTVSHSLAKRLDYEEIDTDARISSQQEKSITEIFKTLGEQAFRDMETMLLQELQTAVRNIISCGGGMAMRERNTALMKKNGIIVLLTAEPETILSRIRGDHGRPVLNGNMNVEYIRTLLEQRNPYYQAAGDVVIATDGRTAEEIAEEIVKKIQKL